jgi:hypothetical protein
MSDKEADVELVRKHVQALGEHFDTVQILVTRHMPAEKNGTVSIEQGSGNWFARRGQARDFVINGDEHVREHARRNHE